ncbi:actinin alpha 2 [Podila epigama]|nr:actinin alpha 2 [Podila epigama]
MSWQLKNKRLDGLGTNSVGFKSNNASGSTSLHLHHEAGDDVVRQLAASQTDTQKTAFMRWVNVQLAKTTTYGPMTSIEKDMKDGKRLIGLLEVVSQEPLKPERGNMRIHQMANVSKALAFLEKKTDEAMGSIGNEDIVDGNVKLTLGLVWIIIYRFQIQHIANTMAELYPSLGVDAMEGEDASTLTLSKGKKKGPSSHQVDAKQALLKWVRFQLDDYSDIIPPIQDFHRSWKTGLAFAALIHRHDPDILPDFYTNILTLPHETVDQWRTTLAMAFDVALSKMSIPRLLEPDDLVGVETPDERSIMTYVSEYYLVMSKHQHEQPPEVVAELQTRRTEAKTQRETRADEDMQAALRGIQEAEALKKQEELEELERIRLRRMEIEGWSIRAAERAKEEEEARRKRREEEEAKSLERKLRREQKEREKAMLLQQANGGPYTRKRAGSSAISEFGQADSENGLQPIIEPMDPEELERRQVELDAKLAEYIQGMNDLSDWIHQQQCEFPASPDMTQPLDRVGDVEPFMSSIDQLTKECADKEQDMSRFHTSRNELLDFENPELTTEQSKEVDQIWWDLEADWTSHSKKLAETKDSIQEMKWILECAQELAHIQADVERYENQLSAALDKRLQDSARERAKASTLDHQESNLVSVTALTKAYTKTLTTVLDSSVYTAPTYLEEQRTDLSTTRLPRLISSLEVARQNLANDRLISYFLGTLSVHESSLAKSTELLVSIEHPVFVTEDVWTAGETVKDLGTRDTTRDLNLEQSAAIVGELKSTLESEQVKIAEIRSTGLEQVISEGKAAMDGITADSLDNTPESMASQIQTMVQDFTHSLEQSESLLSKGKEQCIYASRVLEYLSSAKTIVSQVEGAYTAVINWSVKEPVTEVEAAVRRVEINLGQLEADFTGRDGKQPIVWESIQLRHAGLAALVQDLGASLQERQDIVNANQQLKEFLEFTFACQSTLRDFRSQLHDDPPFRGFGLEDLTPFDDFGTQVVAVGQAFDEFEKTTYLEFKEAAAAMTETANKPGSKQDPTTVQGKVESVNRLLEHIRALRLDRERDVITARECQRLVSSLRSLITRYAELDSDYKAVDIVAPGFNEVITELSERSSKISNECILLEQEIPFRHIVQDPSCADLLKELRAYQTSVQETQALLRSGLEAGQQWNLIWEQFSDRAEALTRYLTDTEQEILKRGIATTDGLADGDEHWKKSEDELHDTEVANNKTLSSLKDFQRLRLVELSTLKHDLHQAAAREAGIEHLDQHRQDQYHEAEKKQQKLREHLQRLFVLTSREGFQLEILGQRLVWSQQLAESKTEVESSVQQCQEFIDGYSRMLNQCSIKHSTADYNTKLVETMKLQLEKMMAQAKDQKEDRYDVTLTIYGSLAELAGMPVPGSTPTVSEDDTAGVQKSVPLHLEVELYEFKNQYVLLERHHEYCSQVVELATQTASYFRKVDAMDSGFVRMTTELKAEKEASQKTLEKLKAIRVEFEVLSEERANISKELLSKPSDKVSDVYGAIHQANRVNLEQLLKTRFDRSFELNMSLDPLLLVFEALLAYQNGLRGLQQELKEHEKWINMSSWKVQSVHDQIKQMFSSWPGDELERQKEIQGEEDMVFFDVDEQIMVDDLDVLIAEMDKEFAHVQKSKQGFVETKQKVELALEQATAHSKQLQAELEWHVDNLTGKIQGIETEIKTRSLQLQALEKRAMWEKEIEVSRSWFKDFAKAVLLFAKEQAIWQANHQKELDDGASMRSFRTTASRLHLTQLGNSVIEFEEMVETFERESRPRVNKAWTELCNSLVYISRSIPDEFLRRQTGLGREFEEIRRQVGYSAQVVTQRKSLEDVAFRLEELDAYRDELEKTSGMTKNGRHGAETTHTKTKEKGWSKFQAKVKKLARK